MQTLDLKGKEKFLDQVSVMSYVGCSHCAVKFPRGHRGPRFGVARRYLPKDHPLRRQVSLPYEYPEAEHAGTLLMSTNTHLMDTCTYVLTTGPDALKDTAFVHTAASRALNSPDKHCIGQKGLPMFAKLHNYCYEKMNIPDVMHNLSRYFPLHFHSQPIISQV